MDATMKIKLKPFSIPNYVIVETTPSPRQEGLKEALKYHLSELDDETLTKLCDGFRDGVFKKARSLINDKP